MRTGLEMKMPFTSCGGFSWERALGCRKLTYRDCEVQSKSQAFVSIICSQDILRYEFCIKTASS